MKHRQKGYNLLSGKGIEIGAFGEPAKLPNSCQVSYFDVIDPKTASARFPEIQSSKLVSVHILGDVDKRDLRKLTVNSQDFVIANHVIEHVACPIAMVEDMFYVLRTGGWIAIAAPDKRYTFDKKRPLTSYEHLETEYINGVDEVDDEHYLEFLQHVGKHVFQEPGRDIKGDIAFARSRREHAHVWDSHTFLEFLMACKKTSGIEFKIEFQSTGEENGIEFFAILRKL
ncbi:MAG TPA: hypothetical protein DCS60_05335 [Opitutae bacterium]|nr:hypothetical protein [Opitutae bacterium]